MKEQGKEVNLPKEQVKKETIKTIIQECDRMFKVELPLLEQDIPIERNLRIGYSGDNQTVTVFKGCKIYIEEGENLGRGWRKFSPRDNGDSGFAIFLTEDLRNRRFIDWDNSYDFSDHEFIEESEKFSYLYLVDFDKNSFFMQLYISPRGWMEEDKLRQFSFLQAERVEELLRQGFPVGSSNISAIMRDPISNPIMPSEKMANNLLEFMRKVSMIERFSPRPFM